MLLTAEHRGNPAGDSVGGDERCSSHTGDTWHSWQHTNTRRTWQ